MFEGSVKIWINKAKDVGREWSYEQENEDQVNGLEIVKEPNCDNSYSGVITLMVREHPKGFGPREVYFPIKF